MAKQRLHKSSRPKTQARNGSKRTVSSSSRVLSTSTEEDSVLTMPFEVAIPSPVGNSSSSNASFGISKIIEINNLPHHVDLDEEHSTLTNEESSVHFDVASVDDQYQKSAEIVSTASVQTNQSKGIASTASVQTNQSKGMVSTASVQTNKSKGMVSTASVQTNQSKGMVSTAGVQTNQSKGVKQSNSSIIDDARQNSLLDVDSSVAESSTFVSTARQDSSVISRESARIRRQSSRASRQSWASSRNSRMSARSEVKDDESSWAEDQPVKSFKQTSVSGALPQPRTPTSMNKPRKLTFVWNTGDQEKPINDDDDDEEEDWSDPESMTSSQTGNRLGPSWSTASITKSASSNSSTSSATSSVALVRKKWRARRRVFRRNVKFNAEEDWCTGTENEDWPGAMAQSRGGLPSTIPEEEETSLISDPTVPVASAPKRLSAYSLFACWN